MELHPVELGVAGGLFLAASAFLWLADYKKREIGPAGHGFGVSMWAIRPRWPFFIGLALLAGAAAWALLGSGS